MNGDAGNWFRSYGNENWEFDERGLMRLRFASINDKPIHEAYRKLESIKLRIGLQGDDADSVAQPRQSPGCHLVDIQSAGFFIEKCWLRPRGLNCRCEN